MGRVATQRKRERRNNMLKSRGDLEMTARVLSNVSLRDVPMSVSVVKGRRAAKEQGALNLDAAIKNVSGFNPEQH